MLKAGFKSCTGEPADGMEERIIISSDAIDLINLHEYKPNDAFKNAVEIINKPIYNNLSFIEKLKFFNMIKE